MSTDLERDTRYALRLCWDFLTIYKHTFIDSDWYRERNDFLMVRKEVGQVLHRHAKKETRKKEKEIKCQ
jgi:hypothetical protein